MTLFKSKVVFTEEDEGIKDIISSLLSDPDSVIDINPDDMSYMVNDEDEKCYVSVDSVGVKLSMHGGAIYGDYRLESGKIDAFKTLIKEETIKRRVAKRERIFKNRLEILKRIKDGITKTVSN